MNEAMQVVVSTTTKTIAASAGQGRRLKDNHAPLRILESCAHIPDDNRPSGGRHHGFSQLRLRDVKATYSPTRLCAKISAGNISSAAVSEPIDGSSGVSTK